MKAVFTILKWIIGIFFIFSGFGGLFLSVISGVIFLLLGLFILPPTYDLFAKKTNLNLSSGIKWITVIIGCIVAGFAAGDLNAESDKEVDLIVLKASELINKGQLDSAKLYIEKAKSQYSIPSNNKAVDLENELNKYNSEDFIIETLLAMSNEELEQLTNDQLSKAYLFQKTLNKEFIALMKAKAPERERIIKEIAEEKERERLAAEIAVEVQKMEEKTKKRKKKIHDLFSPYDGSHPALTRLIKKNMNDPESYSHADTRFRDDGETIFVITKFRGTNAYGGVVLNTISARVDLDGNVLEIVSQN
ncbi:hypothetical protein L3073_05920 [Ancylomarina sp. DW003]|nr:hypothetical protein [Ancylomarina sp. DW003]MDE5421737.1 hypothetical protein [Ancylomarina sp. DW003]